MKSMTDIWIRKNPLVMLIDENIMKRIGNMMKRIESIVQKFEEKHNFEMVASDTITLLQFCMSHDNPSPHSREY